jgi:hypothetical protein
MDNDREILVQFLKQKSVPDLINWLISNLTIQDIYNCLKKYDISTDLELSQQETVPLSMPSIRTSRSSSRSTGPKSVPSGSGGSIRSTISDDLHFFDLPDLRQDTSIRFNLPPEHKKRYHNWYYHPDEYGNFIHYLMYISRDAAPIPIAVLPCNSGKTALPFVILCINKSKTITKKTIQYRHLKKYTHEKLLEKYNIQTNKPFEHIALENEPLTAEKIIKLFETYFRQIENTKDKDIPYCYLLPYGFGNKFKDGFQFIYGQVAKNIYNFELNIKELENSLKHTPCTLVGLYPDPYNNCKTNYHIYNHEEKNTDDYNLKKLKKNCLDKIDDVKWNAETKANLYLNASIPILEQKRTLLNPPQSYDVSDIYHPRRVAYEQGQIVNRNGIEEEGYAYTPLPYAYHDDDYYKKYDVQQYIKNVNEGEKCFEKYAEDNNVDIDQILYPNPATKRTAEMANQLREFLARYNINTAGMKFGKTPNSHKFLVYLFDEKNKDWMRSRDKKPKAQWKTMKQLADIVKYKEKHNMHKKVSKFGLSNFMSFDDVYLNKKQFNYGKDIQFKPLPPSQFGYLNEYSKKHGFPVQRNGFQLYPLGKDAYFKGRHQGVSATFSEEFSKKHGLWKPQLNIQKAKQGPRPEFQFGQSCFGRARPNDYGKEWNSYTQRYQNGIPKSQYGYHGTQSVGTSFTGIAGYPARLPT